MNKKCENKLNLQLFAGETEPEGEETAKAVDASDHAGSVEPESERLPVPADGVQNEAASETADEPEDGADGIEEIYSLWESQSEETKRIYPGFDFDTEIRENGSFREYVCKGLDVTSAYELTHKDEILADAMCYAIRMSEQKIASSVAANTVRERENGLNAGPAASVRVDIASLTNDQLDEYLARARSGEKIDFVTRF